ncbi:uncharacterized protein [Panulirus ornatus]|uniref:uncharacterized protein n=1 Tax=Panulirus ornatus TaxID=150431 RepID=UPI003A887656
MASFEVRFSHCFHKDLPPPLPRRVKALVSSLSSKTTQEHHVPVLPNHRKRNKASSALSRFASDVIPVLAGPAAANATKATKNLPFMRPTESKVSTICSGTSVPSMTNGLFHYTEKAKEEKVKTETSRKKSEVKGCTKVFVKEDCDDRLGAPGSQMANLLERGEPEGKEVDPQTVIKAKSSKVMHPKGTLQTKMKQNVRRNRENKVSNDVSEIVNTQAVEGHVQGPYGRQESDVPAEISRKGSHEHLYEEIHSCTDYSNSKVGTKDQTPTNTKKYNEQQTLPALCNKVSMVHLDCGPQSEVETGIERNHKQLTKNLSSPRRSRKGKTQKPDMDDGNPTKGPVRYHHHKVITAQNCNVGGGMKKSPQNAEAIRGNLKLAALLDSVHLSGHVRPTKKTKARSEVRSESPSHRCTTKNFVNAVTYHFGDVFGASPKQPAPNFSPPRCLEHHSSKTGQDLERRKSHSLSASKSTRLGDTEEHLSSNLTHRRKRNPTPRARPSFELSIKTPLGSLKVSGGRSCSGSRHRSSLGCCCNHQKARLTSSLSPVSRGNCLSSPKRTLHRRHSLSPTPQSQKSYRLHHLMTGSDLQHKEYTDVQRCKKGVEVPDHHLEMQPGNDSSSDGCPCIIICDSPPSDKQLFPVPIRSGTHFMDGGEDDVIVLSPQPKSSPPSHRSRPKARHHLTVVTIN